MARPKKELCQEQFEKLCGFQCTKMEICSWFDVDDMTLDRWIRDTYGQDKRFSEVYAIKRGLGKTSLRRTQWKLAEKNVAMAIWLGKNYLDQKDKSESTNVQKIIIDEADKGL